MTTSEGIRLLWPSWMLSGLLVLAFARQRLVEGQSILGTRYELSTGDELPRPGQSGRADMLGASAEPMLDSLVERLLGQRALELEGRDLAAGWRGANPVLGENMTATDEEEDEGIMKRRQEAAADYFNDIDAHLPPDDPYGSSGDAAVVISGPVNDPQEFEARLEKLANEPNQRIQPSSVMRQVLLVRSLADKLAGRRDETDRDDHNEDRAAMGEPELADMMEALRREQQESLRDAPSDYLEARPVDLLAERRLGDAESDNYELEVARQSQGYATDSSDSGEPPAPSSRYGGSEYIDHPLALAGHQMVQGGAGEGRQLLGPEGTFENVQVIKSDSAVPSYCEPPNPCPLGYTARDGCLESFVNSASFSREYQAKQKCSCDNEHSLFNCAAPPLPLATPAKSSADETDNLSRMAPTNRVDQESGTNPSSSNENLDANDSLGRLADSKLNTLARTIANRYGNLASVQRLIGLQQERAQLLDETVGGPHSAHNSNQLARSARKWTPELNQPRDLGAVDRFQDLD